MEKHFWKPGNIVKLKVPYKPALLGAQLVLKNHLVDVILGFHFPEFDELPEHMRRAKAWFGWNGFTHGAINRVLKSGLVSLYLYDPATSIMYCQLNSLPIPVDFGRDELIVLASTKEDGYHVLSKQLEENETFHCPQCYNSPMESRCSV